MQNRAPNKEGRIVEVKYLQKGPGLFARHIIRECLYNRKQFESLAKFKHEESERKREIASRKREEMIAADMEKNACQIEKLLGV
jgi:hypothetical protein